MSSKSSVPMKSKSSIPKSSKSSVPMKSKSSMPKSSKSSVPMKSKSSVPMGSKTSTPMTQTLAPAPTTKAPKDVEKEQITENVKKNLFAPGVVLILDGEYKVPDGQTADPYATN